MGWEGKGWDGYTHVKERAGCKSMESFDVLIPCGSL